MPEFDDDHILRQVKSHLAHVTLRAVPASLREVTVRSLEEGHRRRWLPFLGGGSLAAAAVVIVAAVALVNHNRPTPSSAPPPVAAPSATPAPFPSTPTSASASPTPSGVAALSIQTITLHTGVAPTGDSLGAYDFAAGHTLYCSNGIRYDDRTVASGNGEAGCRLSRNGLHYAYIETNSSGVPINEIFVDGHRFPTVNAPANGVKRIVGVSDDGQSVMYTVEVQDANHGGMGAVTVYRNMTTIYRVNDSITFDVVTSADTAHYVVVDGPVSTSLPAPETVVYDATVVVPLGAKAGGTPLISANGAHWGVYWGQGGNDALIDGRDVLGSWETAGFITDDGHWTLFYVPTNSVVTDGVSRRVTVPAQGTPQVVLSEGAQHRAALLRNTITTLTVDGSVRSVPEGALSMDVSASTLYVYYLTK